MNIDKRANRKIKRLCDQITRFRQSLPSRSARAVLVDGRSREKEPLPSGLAGFRLTGMTLSSEKLCPLCETPNGCQAGDPACWCNTIRIPKGLLELVPVHLAMKSCICKACVVAWTDDPEGFSAVVRSRQRSA
ncbi:MAG: hypothetical protein RL318_678 [Fibrobacterota bacterium]|jgi:hypothetical protein